MENKIAIKSLMLLFSVILMSSLNVDNPLEKKILGSWTYIGSEWLMKVPGFGKYDGGIKFMPGGKLIYRTCRRRFWCCTGETHYNHKGKWSLSNDSILVMDFGKGRDTSKIVFYNDSVVFLHDPDHFPLKKNK